MNSNNKAFYKKNTHFIFRAERCLVQLVPDPRRLLPSLRPARHLPLSTVHDYYVVHWRWHRHDYSHEQVWIFTGSLTVTLASVSAIGAALALAYFTCEQHHDDYVIGDDNNVTQCHLVMIIMSMSLADDNNVTQCHSMSLCRHFRPQPAILPLHECPRGCDCSWCVSEEYLW